MLEKLKAHRDEILWWEICSLLHDVGKLSDEFLWYRQNWHWMPGGYSLKDPHDHEWLTRDELLQHPEFRELAEFFNLALVAGPSFAGEISVKNAVHGHGSEAKNDQYIALLRCGDSTDSIYDRNNPLFGCEQTDHAKAREHPEELPEMFRSNVFGYEGAGRRVQRGEFEQTGGPDIPRHIAEGSLHRARRELYRELGKLLSHYPLDPTSRRHLRRRDYDAIRNLLRKYFEPAMADTTRPNNDTSLWEHVYSVASIEKALHIHKLLGGSDPVGLATFRIWGFGYDALRYLSYSHRIGDLLGRSEVLKAISEAARRLLEFKIPLGNCVYRDDNSILFLIPAITGFEGELEERILRHSVALSCGEIVPQFTCSDRVEGRLTHIVAEIEKLRKAAATPTGRGAERLAQMFLRNWEGKRVSICAVCRMRPAREEQENKLVCGVCLRRRRGKTTGFSLGEPTQETPMVQEIADQHGRVALLVAKFGLREWLDGRMVRTTFLTEPEAIERTVCALKYLADLEGDDRQQWFSHRGENNYSRILRDVRDCRTGKSHESLFLYARDFDLSQEPKINLNEKARDVERWDALLKDTRLHEHGFLADTDESLVNLLCAKTPTPSTVLDVWETTGEFLQGIAGPRHRFGQVASESPLVEDPPLLSQFRDELRLKPQPRVYVETSGTPANIHKNQSFGAQVAGTSCEAVYEGRGNRFWLVGKALRFDEAWKGQYLELFGDDGSPLASSEILNGGVKDAAYVPYRCISSSPDFLLLMVPAGSAIEVVRRLYSQYQEEFGKAWGRLPFSIGAIFFPQHLPMFSVLDAARRMEGNFRRLHEGPWLRMEMPGDVSSLNLKLGTGKPDSHHPYVRSANPDAFHFKTLLGPVLRLDQSGGKDVTIRPNYFDWEMLGASSDRFRLHVHVDPVTEDDPRKQPSFEPQDLPSRGEMASGPILMEDFDERIAGLWKKLEGEVSDGSIRNLEHALLSRRDSWRQANPEGAEEALNALAASLLPEYLPKKLIDDVAAAVRDGYFFKTLDMYLRILKRPLEKGASDGDGGDESETIPAAILSR